MAERRMFAKTIIDSDAFLDMPISARLLYYDLAMRADDDGFINSPKKIMKFVGATNDDMNILIMRKFIIPFDNGVVVIKHWKIHNYIAKDRYKETKYKEEKSTLSLDENNAYTQKLDVLYTDCIQIADETITQDRLGKDRLGKDRLGKDRLGKDNVPFAETAKEIIDYLNLSLGTNYRYTTKLTQDCIRARLNEKFTVDDFKTVIDKMSKAWKGTDMEQYLRPKTLFGTKFEGYLNMTVTERRKSNKPASVGYDWDNL